MPSELELEEMTHSERVLLVLQHEGAKESVKQYLAKQVKNPKLNVRRIYDVAVRSAPKSYPKPPKWEEVAP